MKYILILLFIIVGCGRETNDIDPQIQPVTHKYLVISPVAPTITVPIIRTISISPCTPIISSISITI